MWCLKINKAIDNQINYIYIENMQLRLLFIVILLGINTLKGCLIVDPTYDFSFKTLFGSSGWEGKGERLKNLINSILEPYLKITVENLEYKNVESKSGNQKDMLFDILTQCQCVKEESKENFIIDIEMQRSKTEEYIIRTNMYGARLLDASSQCNLQYGKQIKNIIISIIDDELKNLKNICVFAVKPFIQAVFKYGETQLPEISPLEDPCTLQIYIQLPVLCRAINAFEKNQIESNYWIENEWLKLLNSRRLSQGAHVNYVQSGIYNIKKEDYKRQDVQEAISILNSLTGNITDHLFEIAQINRTIDEYQSEQIKIENMETELIQVKEELDETKQELTQKDEKLVRVQQIKELRKQVKAFKKNKEEKKPKKSTLPEKLRSMEKSKIKQYVKDEDDSISELSEFLDQMEEE